MGFFDKFKKKPDDAKKDAEKAVEAEERDDEDEDGEEDLEGEEPVVSGNPDGSEWYRTGDVVILPMGEGEEAIWSADDGKATVLPDFVAGLLRRCASFETLPDHAAEIGAALRMGPSEQAALRRHLDTLVKKGLLRSHKDLATRARAARDEQAPAEPIRVVGIVTRDRFAEAERAIAAQAAHAKAAGGTRELVVCDDSADDAKLRARAAELGKEHGVAVRYVGAHEKRRLADRLAAAGIAKDTVEFALFDPLGVGRSIGANRNALHLQAAGARYFSTDDDITGRAAAPPGVQRGLTVTSAHDPTELWFAADAARALELAELRDEDVIPRHEALLGHALGAAAAALDTGKAIDLDLDDAGGLLLRRFVHGRGRVLVTASGIAGDSGMAAPTYFLTLRGEARDRLLQDYPAHRITRGVLRAVTRTAITDSSFLMTGSVGLDGRDVLPPFFPVARNADGVFGAAIAACFAHGAVAHLPIAVEHRPSEARAHKGDDVTKPLAGLRLSDIVILCVQSMPPVPGAPPPADQVRGLGRHLLSLARLSPADFDEMLRLQRWQQIASHATWLSESLRAYDELPRVWADDVQAALETMRAWITRVEPINPSDVTVDVAPRDFVRRFGELCLVWPDMIDEAKRVR